IALALDDHRVAVHAFDSFSPAWRITLASVPGLSSLPRLPATVTVPGLVVWRYWRWLPDWRSRRQPSRSRSLMTCRTFTSPLTVLAAQHTSAAFKGVCRENHLENQSPVKAGQWWSLLGRLDRST